MLSSDGWENLSLPWLASATRAGALSTAMIHQRCQDVVQQLGIHGDLDRPVNTLSGGNQQKIVIGKWLPQAPKVLLLDEPTRGVDVGAKQSIYAAIYALAARGMAIVVVSSELEEVLGLAHQILVMAAGRQTAIVPRASAGADEVLAAAFRFDTPPPPQPDRHREAAL